MNIRLVAIEDRLIFDPFEADRMSMRERETENNEGIVATSSRIDFYVFRRLFNISLFGADHSFNDGIDLQLDIFILHVRRHLADRAALHQLGQW